MTELLSFDLHPNHIRFKVLSVLYQQYYGKQHGIPTTLDMLLKDAGLEGADIDLVSGHLRLLRDIGWIEMAAVSGSERKVFVNITTNGVLKFEEATDRIYERMSEKAKIKQVINTASKLKPIGEYLLSNPEFAKEIGGVFTAG